MKRQKLNKSTSDHDWLHNIYNAAIKKHHSEDLVWNNNVNPVSVSYSEEEETVQH